MGIKLILGDITELDCDAIVNAANRSLLGGGGVDGAIHRKAGRELREECGQIGPCEIGDAKITNGYQLKARHIIHAVGPVWEGGENNEENLLRSTYNRVLQTAFENGLRRLAFPNISTGIYQFPKEKAASIAIEIVSNALDRGMIDEVIFVCFEEENYKIYNNLLHRKNLVGNPSTMKVSSGNSSS